MFRSRRNTAPASDANQLNREASINVSGFESTARVVIAKHCAHRQQVLFEETKAMFDQLRAGPRQQQQQQLYSGCWNGCNGWFGPNISAWHGVIETQAKGTLHCHALLWGGLSPELLSMCVDNKKLREAAQKALDSVITARFGFVGRRVTSLLHHRCQLENRGTNKNKHGTCKMEHVKC